MIRPPYFILKFLARTHRGSIWGARWKWRYLYSLPSKKLIGILYSEPTCSLCVRYKVKFCGFRCPNCPLDKIYKINCDSDDSLYRKAKQALRAFRMNQISENFDNWKEKSLEMLNALRKLK